MDLRSYLQYLRGRWEWVTIFTLTGTITAMALALSGTPKFLATSELFLTTPGYSSEGSFATDAASPYKADDFSQQRARSYVQLATREDLSRRVVEKLGMDMRPKDLAAATSAAVRPDTVLIAVTVKSSSSAEAKILADAVTAELANDIRKLETPSGSLIPVVDPVVTQLAQAPLKPGEPNIVIYLVFGASGGFLAGVTAALWLGRRRTVEGSQIEQLTRRPVLGVVGSHPDDSDRVDDGGTSTAELLREQWSVIQRNVAFEMGDASGQVLAVTSANGSTQSSATAADLASAFARSGSRVALVVAEPNAYTRVTTGERPPVGLAGVIAGESALSDAIQPADDENLYYLAGTGPDDLTPLLRSKKFRGVVDQLRDSFDLVMFDSPEFLRQMESASLSEVVDSVILVATEKSTERRDISAAVRLIDDCHTRLLGTIWKSGSRGDSISTPRHNFVKFSRRLGL